MQSIYKINLCDYDTCTQCKACVNICPKNCIQFVEASDGFSIPDIDRDLCIECGACMKVCHKITPKIPHRTPIHTYAAWTEDIGDRKRSSSGGAFSAIAKNILSRNGIVYGAFMDANLQVKHIAVDKIEDIYKLQGSKYIQSDLTEIYAEIREKLKAGKEVLFTGTPCQVAGLLTFLKSPYENLITCDLICHGVPSQEAFNIYIDKIGLRGKIKDFTFRFTQGWGFQLACQLIAPTGRGFHKKIISPKKSYYLRAFTRGLMFSEACFTCPYAHPERVSDITLADYWGLGVNKPFNHPTVMGISCVLANTKKGDNILHDCTNLVCEERPLEEAVKGNGNLAHVSTKPDGHDIYFVDSKQMQIKELCAKYGISASIRDYLRIVKQWINAHR